MKIKFNFRNSVWHCIAAIAAAIVTAALLIFLCHTLVNLPKAPDDDASSVITNAIDAEKDKVASEGMESVVSE